MPFSCSYCGMSLCSDHHLPENHECSQLYRARKPSEIPVVAPPPKRRSLAYPGSGIGYRLPNRVSWLTTLEARHLILGMALVLFVGISLFLSRGFGVPTFSGVLLLAIILMGSFLLHELAHKFVAQNNGMRAEFRVTPFGALITFISIFSPFFKIIAPGAVMISGNSSNRIIGRVAIVGPLTNILLGFGFVALSLLFTVSSSMSVILSTSAYINGFLATFNLIPVGIIDGKKVFTWNKGIWLLAFGVSISLFLLALFGI